jgi:hypothetical protein
VPEALRKPFFAFFGDARPQLLHRLFFLNSRAQEKLILILAFEFKEINLN